MATVGYATLDVIPSMKGLRSQLERQAGGDFAAAGRTGGKKYGDAAGREAGTSFRSRFSGAMKGFAPLAGIGLGAGVVSLFKDAVAGASDLAETGNKINVIFGSAASEIGAFATDATQNILLTEQAALDAAATFGVFGKSAGLSGADLAGFSTELTALASDLSSFHNTSPEQAIEAIGSALRGEAEPLRAYGVLLDDATLKQEALAQGLIEDTKAALTPAQKVMAAYGQVLEQTTDAQGDAANTIDSLSNQQKILNKQWEEMKTRLGSELLPATTAFVSFLASDALPVLEDA
ncbi:MAG TPA: hypothetical protein VJ782_05135, partial [Aeromicrobium sp.]|nr:hypothetical protein [Aeromicrobium sp.]